MSPRNTADFDRVSDDGDRVKSRRERLGLDKRRLALEAGISRETLAAIENGEGFRRTSLTKIERVLDALEEEAGIGAPPAADAPAEPHIIVVRLKNDVGEVAVEGPVDDLAELEAAARRLLRGLREDL